MTGGTTISDEQRATIRSLAESGRSTRAIAAAVGLSQSTVARVVRSTGAGRDVVVGTDGSRQRRLSRRRLTAAARRRQQAGPGDCPVCFEPMPCGHDEVVGQAPATMIRCWACSGYGVMRGSRGRWVGCSACGATGEVEPGADARLAWTKYEYEGGDWWITLVSVYLPDPVWEIYQRYRPADSPESDQS